MKLLRRGAMVLATVLILACGEDSGPGEWLVTASVSGDASIGAVVAEVEGVGIEAFEGGARSSVFGGPPGGGLGPDSKTRIVVVGSGGRSLTFVVGVLDVANGAPAVTVVDAVSDRDLPVSTQGVTVTVERRSGG